MSWKGMWWVLRQTGAEWSQDKVPRLGAALAFYSVLSLAPLLVIVLAIAGAVFGEEAARGEMVSQMETMVGENGAAAIQDLIVHSQRPGEGTIAAVLGTVALLFGASGVFGELQDSMNTIWEVRAKSGRGIRGIVQDRFFSFAMVLFSAALLIASLIISTTLAAVGKSLGAFVSGFDLLMGALETLLSFGIITVLFALIFKVVPDVEIGWKDTWIGALVTALLFTLGKFLLGLYLGRTGFASAYGAAGSLVILVIWVYYSAQILFFGAELTQVRTRHLNPQVNVATNAEPVPEAIRKQRGPGPPCPPTEPSAQPNHSQRAARSL